LVCILEEKTVFWSKAATAVLVVSLLIDIKVEYLELRDVYIAVAVPATSDPIGTTTGFC